MEPHGNQPMEPHWNDPTASRAVKASKQSKWRWKPSDSLALESTNTMTYVGTSKRCHELWVVLHGSRGNENNGQAETNQQAFKEHVLRMAFTAVRRTAGLLY